MQIRQTANHGHGVWLRAQHVWKGRVRQVACLSGLVHKCLVGLYHFAANGGVDIAGSLQVHASMGGHVLLEGGSGGCGTVKVLARATQSMAAACGMLCHLLDLPLACSACLPVPRGTAPCSLPLTLTDSTTPNVSPFFTWEPTSGSSTYTTSPSSLCRVKRWSRVACESRGGGREPLYSPVPASLQV